MLRFSERKNIYIYNKPTHLHSNILQKHCMQKTKLSEMPIAQSRFPRQKRIPKSDIINQKDQEGNNVRQQCNPILTICLALPLCAGMAEGSFPYGYSVHLPTHKGKHVRLRAVLCSCDPRPSVYQLSSGINWSIPNVCCRAFHTFLCLVSKLVLT